MALGGRASGVLGSSLDRAYIRSFAGNASCRLAVSGHFVYPRSHVLVVSSFLTRKRTTLNMTHLIRNTKTIIKNVNVIVRGSFRYKHGLLRRGNCSICSLTHVGHLSRNRVRFLR